MLRDKLKTLPHNELLTGQLFFRYMGPAIELDMSTRRLFGVSGILALPKDTYVKGEHLYNVGGCHIKTEGGLILGIDPEDAKDITEQARGKTIGHLLLEPIWRI
ncbi:MAG: hypothetical protein ACFFG0_28340 [Candidatus Thorarchaeota archaeon]